MQEWFLFPSFVWGSVHDNATTVFLLFSDRLTDTQSHSEECSPYGQCNFACADHRSWYDVLDRARVGTTPGTYKSSGVLGYY